MRALTPLLSGLFAASLLLFQGPDPSLAQKARARAPKQAQKHAKAQKRQAKAHQTRPRASRRRTARAEQDARALRRSRKARADKAQPSRKGRRGDGEDSRSPLRERLVKAGLADGQAEAALTQVSLGLPSEASPETPDDYLLARPEYVVSYNRSRKVPNWTSWKLSASDFGSTKRQGKFRTDRRIPESWKPATKGDYKRSGFTRGHLVPSGARTATKESNRSTFVFSNIVPQTKSSNGGAWHTVEKHLRKQVEDRGQEVYLAAGPIFDGKPRTIGSNKVAVPEALWKLAVIVPKGTPPEKIGADARVLSVIVPNSKGVGHSAEKYRVTPRQIEKRTGLRFFQHLPKDVRDALRDKLDQEAIGTD